MPAAQSFEDHLAREIVASERLRMGALAVLLAALLAVIAALFELYRADYQRHFASPRGFYLSFMVILGLIAYELAVRHLIDRRARQGKSVPESLRYLNAFVETSVPTLLMILIARHANPAFVVQGAAVLIYGVFIVLSTMRLDFRLSAFTGAVAAAEYVALCWHFAGAGGAAFAGTPLESRPFYLAKGAMLLLAGLAAGFIARIEALPAGGTIPPTRIGVGLHCGEAVTGNVGSALCKQYSITGNVVILAARIEQLNKDFDSQILAAGEVLAAAAETGANAIGPVPVKGRNEPIELYRLA